MAVEVFARDWLEAEGFAGFVTVADLRANRCTDVPQEPGVYAVLRTNEGPITWLPVSTGGHFKRRDPTVPVELLKARVVQGTPVIYIGKADKLRRRVSQYVRFGRGARIGHWGGRYIWQIAGLGQLKVAWQIHAQPRLREAELIDQFVAQFGTMPLANLQG